MVQFQIGAGIAAFFKMCQVAESRKNAVYPDAHFGEYRSDLFQFGHGAARHGFHADEIDRHGLRVRSFRILPDQSGPGIDDAPHKIPGGVAVFVQDRDPDAGVFGFDLPCNGKGIVAYDPGRTGGDDRKVSFSCRYQSGEFGTKQSGSSEHHFVFRHVRAYHIGVRERVPGRISSGISPFYAVRIQLYGEMGAALRRMKDSRQPLYGSAYGGGTGERAPMEGEIVGQAAFVRRCRLRDLRGSMPDGGFGLFDSDPSEDQFFQIRFAEIFRAVSFSLKNLMCQIPEYLCDVGVGEQFDDRLSGLFGFEEKRGSGYFADNGDPDRIGELPDPGIFVRIAFAVEDYAADTVRIVVGGSAQDVVGGIQGHEFAGGDDVHRIRIAFSQRNREPPAYNVAENVVDRDVAVDVFGTEGREEVESGDDSPAGASDAGFGPSRLDTGASFVAGDHNVLEMPVLRCGFPEIIEYGGLNAVDERRRRIMFRVAADLKYFAPHVGKRGGEVGGNGRFSDSSFSVDSYFPVGGPWHQNCYDRIRI